MIMLKMNKLGINPEKYKNIEDNSDKFSFVLINPPHDYIISPGDIVYLLKPGLPPQSSKENNFKSPIFNVNFSKEISNFNDNPKNVSDSLLNLNQKSLANSSQSNNEFDNEYQMFKNLKKHSVDHISTKIFSEKNKINMTPWSCSSSLKSFINMNSGSNLLLKSTAKDSDDINLEKMMNASTMNPITAKMSVTNLKPCGNITTKTLKENNENEYDRIFLNISSQN